MFALGVTSRSDVPGATGAVVYTDVAARVVFYSTRVDSLNVSGATATIEGVGRANGATVGFRVIATDGAPDTFRIELTSGYTASSNILGILEVTQTQCD